MRQAAGQVARRANTMLHLLLGVVMLALAALGAIAWRLGQGPLELPFLTRAIEAAANRSVTAGRVEIGGAAIGWAGWEGGAWSPLDIRLTALRLLEADGRPRLELPDAAVTLSLPWLLRGEIAPSVLELRQPHLRLRRAADGAITLMTGEATADPADAAALDGVLAELMRPPGEDTPVGALTALRITGGHVSVEDAALGRDWAIQELNLDLQRRPAGGVLARLNGVARIGAVALPVVATAEAAGQPAAYTFRLAIPRITPSDFAAAAPALAAIAAPVSGQVTGRLGPDGVPQEAAITLTLETGAVVVGAGARVAIAGGEVIGRYVPGVVTLERATLRLPGGAAPVTLGATGQARLVGSGWQASASATLDAMPIADLPRHWVPGLGGNERTWIVQNVTAGIARNGQWRIEAEAPRDLSGLRVTALSGTLDIADATIHWLRPVPPLERAAGQVTFGLTEAVARLTAGRQAGTQVQARDSTARFQFAPGQTPTTEMQIGLAGPVPDVLAVLQHPRLRLFERRPLPLKEPSGTMEGRVSVAFPLLEDLRVEQIRIRAQARLANVRLADILFGRPIERGQFDLQVDNDGLRVNGTATLAAIAARLGVEMDFRAGPPTQVVMRETVQARVETAALAALGLDAEDAVQGPVALDVRTERRRNGSGRVAIRADLRDATLALAPLGWGKPAGQAASAEATLRLAGEALEAVEAFRVQAPGLALRGTAAFARGARLERLVITEGAVAGTQFTGEVRPPSGADAPWSIALRGPVLDLRRVLEADQPAAAAAEAAPGAPGPAYAVEVRFDRVVLGPQREFAAVQARVAVDGRAVVREGRIAGRAGPNGGFEATITPDGAGRALRLAADDAGALLGGFDVLRNLEGGRLTVQARYAHNGPGAPLSGTAEMSDFSVRNAPGFAKLLQAMTLYGLVEALSGPGLVFARMVAPFALTPETLTLEEARAFSASLGITAKGTIDRRRQRVAMEGTIVPAYIFNSLLGNIPLLGRLFSPETGGGVFAATWRVVGPLDDPAVYVNPLAALTPGFLRGLFGIGQASPP